MAVDHSDIVIAPFSELDLCYVLEPEDGTVAFCADDHVLVVGHLLVASAIFEDIAEGVVRLCSECSCRRLEVLLRQDCRDVGRHEVILRHLARIEPYSERIVAASHIDLSDSGDTRKSRLDVDLEVVDDELAVE